MGKSVSDRVERRRTIRGRATGAIVEGTVSRGDSRPDRAVRSGRNGQRDDRGTAGLDPVVRQSGAEEISYRTCQGARGASAVRPARSIFPLSRSLRLKRLLASCRRSWTCRSRASASRKFGGRWLNEGWSNRSVRPRFGSCSMKTAFDRGTIVPGSFRAILSFLRKAHGSSICTSEDGKVSRSATATS